MLLKKKPVDNQELTFQPMGSKPSKKETSKPATKKTSKTTKTSQGSGKWAKKAALALAKE